MSIEAPDWLIGDDQWRGLIKAGEAFVAATLASAALPVKFERRAEFEVRKELASAVSADAKPNGEEMLLDRRGSANYGGAATQC